MVIEFNSRSSANVPKVSLDSEVGRQIQEKVTLFVASSQQFLEHLQALEETLDAQLHERISPTGPHIFNSFRPIGISITVFLWLPSKDFDYSGFTNSASKTYEAWYVARQRNDDVKAFNGETLQALVRLFNEIGPYPRLPECSALFAQIPKSFFAFQTEVVRLKSLLSLKTPKDETRSSESHVGQVEAVPNIGEPNPEVPDAVASAEVLTSGAKPAAEVLPFGLKRCEVPQTLKRREFKPVTIRNEVQWKLMEALMAAYPNALSRETKASLFDSPNDQGNAKRLRPVLHDLGLTYHDWTLMEWDGDR